MLHAVRISPCLKALFSKMSLCAFAFVFFSRLDGVEQTFKSKILTTFVVYSIVFGHVVLIYSSWYK